MRRLVTWVAVTLGIAALVRKLRRRSTGAGPGPEPASGDPAAELRQKLAESRADGAPVAAPEPPTSTVDERRADVHEEGRAMLEEMRSTGDDA